MPQGRNNASVLSKGQTMPYQTDMPVVSLPSTASALPMRAQRRVQSRTHSAASKCELWLPQLCLAHIVPTHPPRQHCSRT